MTDNAPDTTAKGQPPIIRGYTRSGQTASELTLWLNSPKEGETASENIPDFRGYLQVGKDKVYVSAWAYAGGVSEKEASKGKEYSPYLSLAASIKQEDGSYKSESLSGAIRGMFRTTVDGAKIEVDGSRGLKVIGEIKGTTVLTKGVIVSGNLNGRFPDQETVMELAGSMGFKAEATNGFKSFMDKDSKKTASMAM